MKKRMLALAGAISIATATMAVSVQAKTIRAVSGFGPSHVLATVAYPKIDEKLREFTDGDWKMRDTPAGLLKIPEMNKGLKDGVADMGTVILPYFAADYPETLLVAEMSILGTDNRAISSAVAEYIVNCVECQAEFARNGQIYTGGDATVTYELLTTKPVRDPSDLEGMRIRTAGSVFTRFISEMGGEAVQLSASDMFEAMSSGVIDGTYSSGADLKNAGLYDVVTHVTNIHQGVFNASAFPNVSQKFWAKMDEQERHALVRAAQYGQVASLQGWRDTLVEATEVGQKQGIEFIEPSEAFKAKAEAFKKDHLSTVVATLTERGVVNAAEKVERYQALLEKWTDLVQTVSTQDELAELRYKEIWAGRSLSDYGN